MVKTINGSISLTETSLNLIIDMAEALVKFGILTVVTPEVCLYEFVIRAALDVLIDAAKLIDDAINAAASAFTSALNGAVSAANALIGTIDKLGGHVSKIDADFSSLTSDYIERDDVEDVAFALFNTPAEIVRTAAIEALENAAGNLSTDLFPIPDKTNLTFCNELNTTFVDEVGDSLRKWATWGLEGLAVAGVLLALVLIGIESASYSLMYRLVSTIRERWLPDSDPGSAKPTTERLLGFLEAVDHPMLSIFCSCAYGAGMWFLTYITYPPALLYLFVVSMKGGVGIGVIQIQLWLLSGRVQTEAREFVAGGLDAFIDDIATKINTTLLDISQQFADSSNSVITGIQNDINKDALGWVILFITRRRFGADNNSLPAINKYVDEIESR
ncbi:plasma membrane fusion protein PRM1 [Pseudohyphozyma bogoriensis]|nr:plasma membrane fusion protein PRM1 [Pseudohyphozyma bogoriensis]